MNVAFVYPPMLLAGRPLDFSRIEDDPRGTTGSEIQILSMAREMAARGHKSVLYIPQRNANEWRGVGLRGFARLGAESRQFDAVCVSLDCNVLRTVSSDCTRICFQQINGFEYAKEGFEDYVDFFVSPSANHRDFMRTWTPKAWDRWEVLPNGCYPGEYVRTGPRVPGRVIYASSPDRGLDLLLQQWPRIRAAVPHAELRIFYYSLGEWLERFKDAKPNANWHAHDIEHARRVKVIAGALPALRSQGVTVMGSISRRQMAAEMMQAEVLAYPCSTISYTEGFSCATLEGCASGALPVIAGCDALATIYDGACPMVKAPAAEHIDEWTGLVVRALTDSEWALEQRRVARSFAEKHAWPLLAERVERLITQHRASREGTSRACA